MRRVYFFILVLAIFTTGCYTDTDNTQSTETKEPPKTIINTKLSGSFLNNGVEVADYTLTWADKSATVEGKYFLIDLARINKYDQTIWVEQDGKKMGLAHLPLVENDINTITFEAFSDEQSHDVSSNQEIGIVSGDLLSINPSSFTGSSVVINTKTITSADQLLTHGYNSDYDLEALSDITIWHVDIPSSDDGAVVKVTSGKSWYRLDETKDKWIRVALQDEKFNLTSSGYFTIANSVPGTKANGKVLRDDTPISYQWYEMRNSRKGRSTAKGNWISILPQESEIKVDILNPCLEKVSEETLTTTNEADFVENIIVGPGLIFQEINTEIIDCDGNSTDQSIIQITEASGDTELYFFSDPSIVASIPLCESEFSISAYDIENQAAGFTFPWMTTIEDEITYLSTCPDFVDGYSVYKIRDDIKVYPTFSFKSVGTVTELMSSDENIILTIKGNEKGAYNVDDINVKIYDPSFGDSGYAVACENSPLGCGIDDCYISHINESDNWVRVSFSGNIWMQTISPLSAGTYPVEGMIICKSQ